MLPAGEASGILPRGRTFFAGPENGRLSTERDGEKRYNSSAFARKDTNYIYFSQKKALFFVCNQKKPYLRTTEMTKDACILSSKVRAAPALRLLSPPQLLYRNTTTNPNVE